MFSLTTTISGSAASVVRGTLIVRLARFEESVVLACERGGDEDRRRLRDRLLISIPSTGVKIQWLTIGQGVEVCCVWESEGSTSCF